jgi:hypothetical protein
MLYLVEFFLEWKMFWMKVVEKIKTYIICLVTFFSENCAICEVILKKYGIAGQPTDDTVIQHMHFACWITVVTNHSAFIVLHCLMLKMMAL